MKQVILTVVALLTFSTAYSQCGTIVQTPEGIAKIELQIIDIKAPSSCPNGYVYRPVIKYGVGTEIELSKLEGYVGCDGGSSFFELPLQGGTGTVVGTPLKTEETNCQGVTNEDLHCTKIELRVDGPHFKGRLISPACDDL